MSNYNELRRRRQAPGQVLTFVRQGETSAQAEARKAANPYTRLSLAQAFDAGWFGWAFRKQLGMGYTNPLMSGLARAAYLAGYQARDAYEATNKQEGQQ